jgi:hypothetical protein
MSRSGLFGALVIVAALCATSARSQNDLRPPVGGVSSPEDAMIFYQAHGGDEACGANCTDWIAAEGAIQWDTFKRLFAFLDRFGQNKRPLVLDIRGPADLKTAMSLGKIIRDRGLDVRVGTTRVAKCASAPEADCFALKRAGQPLDASVDTSAVECDFACVIVLAGGVHRSLPADAGVVIGSSRIRSRLAPNVSQDIKQDLSIYYNEQIELYLAQMGISPEIVGIIDRNAKNHQATRLSNEQCLRLGIVTGLAL